MSAKGELSTEDKIKLITFVLAALLLGGWYFFSGNDENPDQPLTPSQIRQNELSKCFNGDGSHIEFTKAIKAAMNDPDSYKHDQTHYIDQDSVLIITTQFRGANAFGGIVRQTWKAVTSAEDCTVIVMNTE